MNAAGRLVLFAGAVVVAFGGAFLLAGAIVPQDLVDDWNAKAEQHALVGVAGGHHG